MVSRAAKFGLRGPTSRSAGAILVLTLIFILLLALVATTVLQTAALQTRMASNHQLQEEAFQNARAIATELSLRRELYGIDGVVGYTQCGAADVHRDCDSYNVLAPQLAGVSTAAKLSYRVTRLGPEMLSQFPLREAEGRVSSAGTFGAVAYEIEVDVDGSEQGLGSASVARGVAVRVWLGL